VMKAKGVPLYTATTLHKIIKALGDSGEISADLSREVIEYLSR